jgi:branched-chain amino acid aminotransferase
MYSFLNNQFLPAEKTFIHVSDLATQRGYGIFDFLKAVNGKPLFIDDYLDRFYRSAAFMRLEVSQSREELKNIIHELIGKNGLTDSGIKLILTGGYSPDGYELTTPNLIITLHALIMPSAEYLEKGIKIITHEYVRDLPHVKSINYIMGVWLQNLVKEEKAADALYYLNGQVSEFPRCNIFIVREDGVAGNSSRKSTTWNHTKKYFEFIRQALYHSGRKCGHARFADGQRSFSYQHH